MKKLALCLLVLVPPVPALAQDILYKCPGEEGVPLYTAKAGPGCVVVSEIGPPPDRWKLVSSTESTQAFIDTETLQPSGGSVSVWVKYLHAKSPQRHHDGKFSVKTLERVRYDCVNAKSVVSARNVYDKSDEPIWIPEPSPLSSPVAPDTIGELVMQEVCPSR